MTPREQAERFLYRADELRRSRVVKSSFPVSLNVKWDPTAAPRFTLSQPDEEDLRSLLLTLRQFISPGEPVFLFSIFNLCQKHISAPALRQYLVEARSAWAARLKHDGLGLEFHGQTITPEYITDLWINGEYFHNDDEKHKALYALAPPQLILSRHKFLNHLITTTEHVLYVASVLNTALREGSFQ